MPATCASCAESGTCPAAPAALPHVRRIALAGNPNVGKSTLFNLLTGIRQRTGNYAGVTVERKVGRLAGPAPIDLIDLPGLYTTEASSLDEEVAVGVLTGTHPHERAPDLVACVVDASNLERNLLLATQIIDLGRPTLLILNMMDVAERAGQAPDPRMLAREMRVPVVAVSARRREGLDRLVAQLQGPLPTPSRAAGGDVSTRLERVRAIASIVQATPPHGSHSVTDRLDTVLTHHVAGPLIFLAILFVTFQAIFTWATPATDLIEAGVGALASLTRDALPPGLLADLLTDGVIAGVGAVVVFLPQILLLFLLVSVLEDTGYMARATFISDRLMHRLGLSGQSVIPLVSGYACAVPAIMATRTIPNHRDRLVTMMVIPLMSCSARLPIYTLLISAIVPAGLNVGPVGARGIILFGIYIASTSLALLAAAVMKNRIFYGSVPMMAMELPSYRLPQAHNIAHRLTERSWTFISQAGRVILVMTVVLWFLAYFPRDSADSAPRSSPVHTVSVEAVPGVDTHSVQIIRSYVGRIGRAIEPAMRPLGFDWKMTAGIITAFAARETLISTLATLYSVGDSQLGASLTDRLRADRWPDTGLPVFTPLVALSLMTFLMIACQCMSTLAVIRRETGTWRWPAIGWLYMTTLAYVASFVIYQGGMLLGLG